MKLLVYHPSFAEGKHGLVALFDGLAICESDALSGLVGIAMINL